MSYKSDFENDRNWSAADTNIKLGTSQGEIFRQFLKNKSVETVIRYYASTRRAKTISATEARALSADGFNLLPVYQDKNRLLGHFGADNGRTSAQNALDFADYIGQPDGSAILFAVDADFSLARVQSHIVPYFEAIQSTIGSRFRIGAYGSGTVLRKLLEEGLIEIPWISMSRAFHGTEEFFYSNDWALRQVPPARTHDGSGVSYDRNVLNWSIDEIGAFQIDSNGQGFVVGSDIDDGILGGRVDGIPAEPTVGTADLYVSTEGLNLRAEPNGEILRELTIGQPATDLGNADQDGWKRVEVDGQRGVAFGKYLRRPSTDEIEMLLQNTISEWVRFDKGRAHEESDPYYRYVGEMWSSIGEAYDGRSRYPNGDEVPWSAAFISFVVRKSGNAYAGFKFAASHSVFSHDAIQARVLNRTDRPFWGYRRTEKPPEIGDIVHRNRGNGNFSYDFAENHSQFKSHSDIVVEVTSHVARVIGGNVGDTVSMRRLLASGDDIQEYRLDSAGFIDDGQRVIAILKNRAADVA